ncbi:MAG: glycosyltransferase [Promethearchaeota archaeon]
MTRRLHITQVVHDFHPVIGGLETYAYNLARGLIDAGHTVTVYTARVPHTPSYEHYHGINIHRLRAIARPFNFPLLPGLFRALTRQRCDILHAHINSPMTVDLTAFASQLTKAPLVVTYHADALISDIAANTPFFRTWLDQIYRRACRRVANIAQQLIVTSPLYRNTSLFLQDYLHKTTVIPATVNPFFLKSRLSPLQAKDSFGFKPNTTLLLFVGRLVPYKDLHTLLRAFQHVHQQESQVHLALAGSGPLKPSLQDLSTQLGISHAVHFLGILPRRRLRDIYTACDIFVLPSRSRSEAFGVVQLEAMAQEKPVVATTIGGIPYVVRHDKTGLLVPPSDVTMLAQALLRLVQNPHLREELGKAGRRRLLEHFTRESTTRTLEAVYYKILQ